MPSKKELGLTIPATAQAMIVELIEKHRLTLSTIARLSGLSVGTILSIKKGRKPTWPTERTLLRMYCMFVLQARQNDQQKE